MCEILLIASPEPVRLARTLAWADGMERLGVAGFGWGVAWREGGRVLRYRHPRALGEDAGGRVRLAETRSDRFLVHLRRPARLSTVGLHDTQPFLAEPARFAFCHNGAFERHEAHRRRFAGRLNGHADSEVGFSLFGELLAGGLAPGEALAETHRQLGGSANLGYLGADGALVVYAGFPVNPVWRFSLDGAQVAATALHSDDASLFDLLFPEAEDREPVVGPVPLAAPEG